jgi:N-6 DNA Methylase
MKGLATLAATAMSVSEAARNEAQLVHELEIALHAACRDNNIPWMPFTMERALKNDSGSSRFADVAHGAVIIEYEPPKCFKGKAGAKAAHARHQAEEYAQLIAIEEGRDLAEYVLVAWDGTHITFGAFDGENPVWNSVVPFDLAAAERLMRALADGGRPLVHPLLLQAIAGPDSAYGAELIPLLYESIRAADDSSAVSKTKMLFTEWRRLFSQVVGFQPDHMKALLARQEISHGQPYQDNPAAYLFALNTYIAIIAKVVAAAALPNPSQDVLDTSVPVDGRLQAIESGALFEQAGILNMLSGDFFSWYLDDPYWKKFKPALSALLTRLAAVDFTVTRKNPDTTRDLFKGIYERFIPREIRHALGEFYTPDWLAEHALDLLNWDCKKAIIDPACGSGTFLLEAIRRRRIRKPSAGAKELLDGIHGIDLNPLAVLAAKGSLAVFLSPHLDPQAPIRLPVYLADAIRPARADIFSNYSHVLMTEVGPREFSMPQRLIEHEDFYKCFGRIRGLIDADLSTLAITKALLPDLQSAGLDPSEIATVDVTIANLEALHRQGWNGIWCSILADRFAAGAIPPAAFVCGNPPWVKWSNLPAEYAQSIRQSCRDLGVFSADNWVGGIESDISTVLTFQAIRSYLATKGKLGFLLPGSVFTTESSAGFRSLKVGGQIACKAVLVEDFNSIRPFDGVSNHPTFLMLERDAETAFPVPYRTWTLPKESGTLRKFASAAQFKAAALRADEFAVPVPGAGSSRPWLVGSADDHLIFGKVFSSGGKPQYQARKGVTTDRNGIFWVNEIKQAGPGLVQIRNAADVGKTRGIPEITASIEAEHIFPLLRGRGVNPFSAIPEHSLRLILPQRGMHGDENLPIDFPKTFGFLNRFREHLEKRSSLKRFQKGKPFYSLWSTGDYTFSPFKVLWREMGNKFAAAYIGSTNTLWAGTKTVVPDHKLYFIPVDSESEAAYLTAFLNAPIIAGAVSAYGAQLSLGASVAEYLRIPRFDPTNSTMQEMSAMAVSLTSRGGQPTPSELAVLDRYVRLLLSIAP